MKMTQGTRWQRRERREGRILIYSSPLSSYNPSYTAGRKRPWHNLRLYFRTVASYNNVVLKWVMRIGSAKFAHVYSPCNASIVSRLVIKTSERGVGIIASSNCVVVRSLILSLLSKKTMNWGIAQASYQGISAFEQGNVWVSAVFST